MTMVCSCKTQKTITSDQQITLDKLTAQVITYADTQFVIHPLNISSRASSGSAAGAPNVPQATAQSSEELPQLIVHHGTVTAQEKVTGHWQEVSQQQQQKKTTPEAVTIPFEILKYSFLFMVALFVSIHVIRKLKVGKRADE